MGDYCNTCGSSRTTVRAQTFKNGTQHLRRECDDCGSFIKFERGPGFDLIVCKDHETGGEHSKQIAQGLYHLLKTTDAGNKKLTLIAKFRD